MGRRMSSISHCSNRKTILAIKMIGYIGVRHHRAQTATVTINGQYVSDSVYKSFKGPDKGEVYRTMVRPALVYGADIGTEDIGTGKEIKLDVAEM